MTTTLSFQLACLWLGALDAAPLESFGRVVAAQGGVLAKGREGDRALKAGDRVFRGEHLVTDDAGHVKLLLEDRSVISLGPKSNLQLVGMKSPEVPKTTVKLFVGRLWANVQKLLSGEPKFDVETQNAVAGVRGTSFFAEVLADRERFTVANGGVQTSGGPLITNFQQVEFANGHFTNVITVSPEAIALLIRELSTAGGLGDHGRIGRMESLEHHLGGQHAGGFSPDQTQNVQQLQALPIIIDPQQTSGAQQTLIHGHINIIQP